MVIGVVGATALAALALVTPWIEELAKPHEDLVSDIVRYAGLLLCGVAVFVLTSSIRDAQITLDKQRGACIAAESDRRTREYRAESFAWTDALQARSAELQQPADERLRMGQERGLTPAVRKARQEALRRRTNIAQQREKALTQGLDRLDPDMDQEETIEAATLALGC